MPFISSTTGSFYAGRRSVAGLWSPETDITALGWIDASDTSSYTTSGSNLTAVTDKSGTYGTIDINNTPTVSNTLNSLPVFTFENDNESLKSTTYEPVVSSGNHWAIGVFRYDSLNNNKDSFCSFETNGSPNRV